MTIRPPKSGTGLDHPNQVPASHCGRRRKQVQPDALGDPGKAMVIKASRRNCRALGRPVRDGG